MSNYKMKITSQQSKSPKISFQYSTETLHSKKLNQTQDCNTVKSRVSEVSSLEVSMFSSSSSSSKRVNQIMPKSKIVIPPKVPNQNPSSSNSLSIILNTPQSSARRQSFKYSSIKPLFNWKKYTPLCGFQTKTGQNGCLCGDPCPLQKQWTKNYRENDFKLYQQLLNQKISSKQEQQILKDITRTHSECLTFSENQRFQEMLKQVLNSYTVYDPQIGYVQGMNLIAGVILYHMKNSELTFWAFVDLMDEQELRMIYLPGFQYLKEHQNNILNIMEHKVNDLMEKMDELDIIPSSFLNGWLLSLMSTCIPLEYMHNVIDKFRKNGWKYVYQLIITYLLFLKQQLLRAQDQSEFLLSINTVNSRQYGVIWQQLVQSAVKFPLTD